jgi:hypothetical protein
MRKLQLGKKYQSKLDKSISANNNNNTTVELLKQ